MNIINNFRQLSLVAACSFLLIACSSDNTDTSTTNTADVESTEISTRGTAARIASKAYHYKSLATFKDGEADVDLASMANLADKQVNLVVLYDANALWAAPFHSGRFETTGDDKLNSLMKSYKLEIIEQFTIDEDNEGLVFEPNAVLENPTEAARQISLVNDVFMVQIKEVPTEEIPSTTVAN